MRSLISDRDGEVGIGETATGFFRRLRVITNRIGIISGTKFKMPAIIISDAGVITRIINRALEVIRSLIQLAFAIVSEFRDSSKP